MTPAGPSATPLVGTDGRSIAVLVERGQALTPGEARVLAGVLVRMAGVADRGVLQTPRVEKAA